MLPNQKCMVLSTFLLGIPILALTCVGPVQSNGYAETAVTATIHTDRSTRCHSEKLAGRHRDNLMDGKSHSLPRPAAR
jgi:hypothetical protein